MYEHMEQMKNKIAILAKGAIFQAFWFLYNVCIYYIKSYITREKSDDVFNRFKKFMLVGNII